MSQDAKKNVQSAAVDRMLAEKEHLVRQIEALNKTSTLLTCQLEEAQQKLVWFEEQFKSYRQRQFGKSSETGITLQLALIFNADEQLSAQSSEVSAEEKSNRSARLGVNPLVEKSILLNYRAKRNSMI